MPRRTTASWRCCARTTPASAATPRRCTASLVDDEKGQWLAICEFLEEVELLDSADNVAGWTIEHLEAAIRGLAALQAIHWGREQELRREPWLGKVLGAADMAAMKPLWQALEIFSRQRFATWAGPELEARRRQLIDTIEEWWPELESSRAP